MIKYLAFAALFLGAACAAPTPSVPGSGGELAGTSWRQRSPAAPADAQPTISFEADGRAGGSTGCNRWFATVVSDDGGGLRFTQAGSTRRMCAEAAMAVEQRFLDALNNTVAIEREGDMLRLIGAGAAEIAVFEVSTASAQP